MLTTIGDDGWLTVGHLSFVGHELAAFEGEAHHGFRTVGRIYRTNTGHCIVAFRKESREDRIAGNTKYKFFGTLGDLERFLESEVMTPEDRSNIRDKVRLQTS
jgi:hypothetical protein